MSKFLEEYAGVTSDEEEDLQEQSFPEDRTDSQRKACKDFINDEDSTDFLSTFSGPTKSQIEAQTTKNKNKILGNLDL
eukprot:Awhi_evm1s7860